MAATLRFPQNDLASSITVAKTLQGKGGWASPAELAIHLGYKSHNNGAYLARVASARLYGLLDSKGSSITPSDLAIQIIAPVGDAELVQAKIESFLNAPLFAELFGLWENKPLPEDQAIATILTTRYQVPAAQAKTVAARFLDSATQAGLRDLNPGQLIRPSTKPPRANVAVAVPPAVASPSNQTIHPRPPVRLHPIISGALDLLPPVDQGLDEASLSQWLSFFEGAVRLLYKQPVATTSPAAPAPGATATERGGVS